MAIGTNDPFVVQDTGLTINVIGPLRDDLFLTTMASVKPIVHARITDRFDIMVVIKHDAIAKGTGSGH
jgi:hypothetical protein